jgi:hypothetical protein
MTSTLIVEDGTGLPNADSFASLADALTYHAKMGNAGWIATGVTDTTRDVAMRQATRYIRDRWAGRWQGDVINSIQSLPFPRFDVYDANGILVLSTSVPSGIQEATFDLALRALVEDIMPDIEAGAGAEIASAVTVGPVSVSSTLASASSTTKQYTTVELKVRPYLSSQSGRVSRG